MHATDHSLGILPTDMNDVKISDKRQPNFFHVYDGLFIFTADINLAVYFLADIRQHNFRLRFG